MFIDECSCFQIAYPCWTHPSTNFMVIYRSWIAQKRISDFARLTLEFWSPLTLVIVLCVCEDPRSDKNHLSTGGNYNIFSGSWFGFTRCGLHCAIRSPRRNNRMYVNWVWSALYVLSSAYSFVLNSCVNLKLIKAIFVCYYSRTDIHRVGRTARLGRKGEAVLFLTPSELGYLPILEKMQVLLPLV